MANPRQRRKAKSSSHKAVSHSQRAKKLLKKMPAIRGPKVLQDAWDKSKTVRQNYAALGLQHTLNPLQSGGSEIEIVYNNADSNSIAHNSNSARSTASAPSTIPGAGSSAQNIGIPKGFGRIHRDSSGNVLRVELPESEDTDQAALDNTDSTGLEEPQVDEHILGSWAGRLQSNPERAQQLPKNHNDVVVALETLSSSANPVLRHTSNGERSYLSRLVGRYGEDYEKMSKDRRLNPEQKTVGALKRAIRRAGGVNALLHDQDSS
ncbi:ribosome biogenesis protein Nop16 [Hygrophoropsis aurantiaca]|uniref:Ribosome biogenesis protein Nop16 n=1 Tax=Hygrophoropsis aurantiaca TaxID=72124 RepID=A0ACB8A899_9AGAM|nr:ribosome biogenesis protein Nop16 [Hygrophoropsis aurantiaca]